MNKVYLQMFSLHNETRPIPEMLERIAGLGYAGIEFAGSNYGGMDEAGMKNLLESLRLEPLGAHVRADTLLRDLPYVKAIGGRYMIIASHRLTNREDCLKLAESLNEWGRICKAEGLKAGYHNHTQEFHRDGGDYLLDILVQNTDPEMVIFELDAGWAAAAGVDVVNYLKVHAGRIELLHVNESDLEIGPEKPFPAKMNLDGNGRPIFTPEELAFRKVKDEADCPLGKGLLDWNEVIPAAKAIGVKEFIVERRHSYLPDTFDSLKEDLDYLKGGNW